MQNNGLIIMMSIYVFVLSKPGKNRRQLHFTCDFSLICSFSDGTNIRAERSNRRELEQISHFELVASLQQSGNNLQ
ncbi:hypothetical protein D3C76_272520 [compost metagenome]